MEHVSACPSAVSLGAAIQWHPSGFWILGLNTLFSFRNDFVTATQTRWRCDFRKPVVSVVCASSGVQPWASHSCVGNQVAWDKDSGIRLSFLTGYSWELNVLSNSTLKPWGNSWELRVGQQACFLLYNGCVKIGTLPDFWCWWWWLDQSPVGNKGKKDIQTLLIRTVYIELVSVIST